jgi:hypothetical protein
MDLQKTINEKEARILELKLWLNQTDYQRDKLVQKVVLHKQEMDADDIALDATTNAARAEINQLEQEVFELNAELVREMAEMEYNHEDN